MTDEMTKPKGKTSAGPGLFGTSSPFKSVQDEVERIFQAFAAAQTSWKGGILAGEGATGLRVDIGESDDEIQDFADLPGIAEDEVEVVVENDLLRLRAERKTQEQKSGHCQKDWPRAGHGR